MTAIALGTLALVLVLGTVAPRFADDVSVKGYSEGRVIRHEDVAEDG